MKFLVDRMLGKLAKALRLLGYDATYYQGDDRYQLYRIGRQEGRTILTRNTRLLPKKPEDQIVTILEDRPAFQVRELIRKGYVTFNGEGVFSRCLLCNTTLEHIPRENVEGKVPDHIFYNQQDFFQCPQCGRIYWPGTHQKNMQGWVEKLFKS